MLGLNSCCGSSGKSQIPAPSLISTDRVTALYIHINLNELECHFARYKQLFFFVEIDYGMT